MTPHLYLCRDVCPFNASDDRHTTGLVTIILQKLLPPKVLKSVPQRMADRPNDFQEIKNIVLETAFKWAVSQLNKKIIDTFPQFIGWLMGFVAKSLRLVLKPGNQVLSPSVDTNIQVLITSQMQLEGVQPKEIEVGKKVCWYHPREQRMCGLCYLFFWHCYRFHPLHIKSLLIWTSTQQDTENIFCNFLPKPSSTCLGP